MRVKKKPIFRVDIDPEEANVGPYLTLTTNNETKTMIEKKIDELIEALNRNTESNLALAKGKAPAPLKVVEKDELEDTGSDDDLDTPTPAKKAAKKAAKEAPAPAKKSAKEAVTHEALRNLVRNERERLKNDVSLEAVAAHKTATRAVLDKFKAETLTTVTDEQLPAVFAAIKAIDVTTKSDDDDLGEDDDL